MSHVEKRGPVLESARLRGDPVAARHLTDLHRIFGDREVTRTLGGVRTALQIEKTFERFDTHWRKHGYGPWFFRDTGDDFVGYAGVIETKVDNLEGIELLYALTANHWNQGFASEMAEAVVAEAFLGLGIEELLCFTMTTNRASQRVMEKAGFVYQRDITHATLPHVLYRQTASEWRRHVGAPAPS
jgi:ribosomal-protein-alanine N-acetyltransferase